MKHFTKHLLVLALAVGGVISAWAEDVTTTYTFTSKSWGAKIEETTANWTSGKDGAGFSNNGIQITTNSTGANGTSPKEFTNVSKIVVTYNTNKSKGAGTLAVKIGNNEENSQDWAYSGNNDGTSANFTAQFDYATPQSGEITLTGNTKTNSIYIVSIAITCVEESTPEGDDVATPTFSPTAGSFTTAQSVEISCATDGVSIYYTTNGDDPTSSSTPYESAILVTTTTTIKAIAIKGEDKSEIASATYTIQPATPTINSSDKTAVTITGTTEGATIYYTTDGSTPTSNSSTYSTSLNITETTTIKAVAIDANGNTSDVAETTIVVINASVNNSPGTNYFVKVTDASELAEGDNIIIVAELSEGANAMSTSQNTNNRGYAELNDYNGNGVVSAIDNTVQKFVLLGTTNAWYFYTGSGFLYAASSSSNYLRTEEEADNNNNAKAKIEITDGNATIKFQGSYTRNTIRYNSGSTIFSCYAESNNMKDVQIYKEVETKSITISDAGYATYYSDKALDFTDVTGLTAYTASVASDAVTFTQVTKVPANTGLLLKGDANTYTVPVTSENIDGVSSALEGVTVATAKDAGIFVLMNGTSGVGFYKTTNAFTVGANTAYLPASAATAKVRFIGLDGEEIADGIEAIEATEGVNNGAIYNLAGQRVTAPTKGIYIKNGKKFIIK